MAATAVDGPNQINLSLFSPSLSLHLPSLFFSPSVPLPSPLSTLPFQMPFLDILAVWKSQVSWTFYMAAGFPQSKHYKKSGWKLQGFSLPGLEICAPSVWLQGASPDSMCKRQEHEYQGGKCLWKLITTQLVWEIRAIVKKTPYMWKLGTAFLKTSV